MLTRPPQFLPRYAHHRSRLAGIKAIIRTPGVSFKSAQRPLRKGRLQSRVTDAATAQHQTRGVLRQSAIPPFMNQSPTLPPPLTPSAPPLPPPSHTRWQLLQRKKTQAGSLLPTALARESSALPVTSPFRTTKPNADGNRVTEERACTREQERPLLRGGPGHLGRVPPQGRPGRLLPPPDATRDPWTSLGSKVETDLRLRLET